MGPVAENLDALRQEGAAVGRDFEQVDGLVVAGGRVDVGSESHADRLEVLGQVVPGEMLAALERHVLGHVRQATLVVGLEDRADTHRESKLGPPFRYPVDHDVVAQAIVQRPAGHARIQRQRVGEQCCRRIGGDTALCRQRKRAAGQREGSKNEVAALQEDHSEADRPQQHLPVPLPYRAARYSSKYCPLRRDRATRMRRAEVSHVGGIVGHPHDAAHSGEEVRETGCQRGRQSCRHQDFLRLAPAAPDSQTRTDEITTSQVTTRNTPHSRASMVSLNIIRCPFAGSSSAEAMSAATCGLVAQEADSRAGVEDLLP